MLGCTSSINAPTTTWKKTGYTEADGIVEIATAWGLSHLCTGSLLSETVVLTAAHCVDYPAEDLYIVYGCNDIKSVDCNRVTIKKTIKYPAWRKEFVFADDIAIIITDKPIQDIGISKISSREKLEEGLSVRAFGFGERNGSSGVLYVGLGRVTRDYERELVIFMPGKLDPNPGDSGGPILILNNDEWEIVGILSRARWETVKKKEVFEQTGYAIYTKPVYYIDWINETIYKEECTVN